MTATDISYLLIIVLLLLSSMFSGTESALFSLDAIGREKLRRISKEKEKYKARIILDWLSKPEQTLAILLLGNLSVNIFITEVGHGLIKKLTPADFSHVEIVSLLSVTIILLIFGEVIPKVIALQSAIKWSLFFTWPIRIWFSIAKIVAVPIVALSKNIAQRLPDANVPLSENELLESIKVADSFGIVNQEELNVLKGSITYHYDTAYSAMKPQVEVHRIAHNVTPAQAKKYFIENKINFALIYHHKMGNVLGYIETRHLVLTLAAEQRSLQAALQAAAFLPETMLLQDAVEYFIKNQSEVAVINDENGKASGVLFLKDILGKLMGETTKEPSNTRFKNIERISSNKGDYFRLNGAISLLDFNDYFNVRLESADLETLSGFLLKKLDGFPKDGAVLRYQNFEFFSIEVENYRIKRVFMRHITENDDE